MQVFGYIKGRDSDSPSELEEVTLQGSPAELRRVAEFLKEVADQMEHAGEKFGHAHASLEIDDWKASCDLIVHRET